MLSEKAQKIWDLKYARTREDGSKEPFETGAWRVANFIASAEKEYNKTDLEIIELAANYYRLITNLMFLPGGRILANAGTNITNNFNCFVLPIGDSRQSIYEALGDSAEIFATGGGIGYNLSDVREKGALVKGTGGKASGPLSFMELFDTTGEVISQASRRGAQMGILDCDHPDIQAFIDYKSIPNTKNERLYYELKNKLEDKIIARQVADILIDNQLTHFNISVGLTDDFMKAVIEDKDWNLTSRVDGAVVKTIKAKDLMRQIAESAWRSGDPGVIFLDKHEASNMTPYLGKIRATNPCFHGDMQLLTSNGYKDFFSLNLAEEPVTLINAEGEESIGKVWYSGKKDIVELRLSNGNKIKSTPDHVYKLIDGSFDQAQNLKGKQLYPYINKPDYVSGLYSIFGFVQGDGNLTRLNSNVHKGVEFNLNKKDYEVSLLLEDFGYKYTIHSERVIYVSDIRGQLKELGFSAKPLPERVFPTTYDDWELREKAGFLQGCFSANGCVNNRGRITYKSTCKEFINKLKEILQRDFAIDSYITTNKSHPVEFSNGTYTVKESYDLNISRFDEKVRFFNRINFIQAYKTELLAECLFDMAPYVTSIKEDGQSDVYDFSEPKTNWGVVEGFVVHNCAEIGLLPYEPCCLGSINLAEMIEDGQISEKKLAWTVTMAIRFLDDVHTINKTPVEKVNIAAKQTRRLGLGVLGWADTLVKLGIPYDSAKALELAEEVMKSIDAVAWGTSQYLAEERGPFEAYRKDSVVAISPNISNDTPLRNVAVTAIAPTGSISLLCDVNSGIEPFFALTYTRYITEGVGNVIKDKIVEVNPYVKDFIWKRLNEMEDDPNNFNLSDEESMLAFYVNQVKETGTLSKEIDIESVFKTAGEISWKAHIDMQAAFQKWTSNAVSKTINMPNSATIEDIENAYIYAWQAGLKSVALYRDGSKSFQILNK